MYDVIIVGAGPAGMAAAYELQNKNVLMIDVGHSAPNTSTLNKNLYDLKVERPNLFNELVGQNFESLRNIDQNYLSPKLKSPYMNFITERAKELSPIECEGFEPVQSFAFGGLANAWGAGLLEFNDYDLKDFPIKKKDLAKYYTSLTNLIGINGELDDLTQFLGDTDNLQSAHRLCALSSDLLAKYYSHKKYFNENSLFIGRHRIALLTQDKDKRLATTYDNLEFFKPNDSAIYNPALTIKDLILNKKLNYQPGFQVIKFQEISEGVEVTAKNIQDQTLSVFKCKKLILAAGCLNTSRIVLTSCNDFVTKLPLLDNRISYIPFLVPKFIGSQIEKEAFSAQLLIVYDDVKSAQRIQATFYGINGPLKSDLLFDFPLSIKGNFAATKYLIPAMAIAQLFYDDSANEDNFIKLDKEENLKIVYKYHHHNDKIEKDFINLFRKFGYFSHAKLCKFPQAGNSFHYAGSLPMAKSPKKYQTGINGLLHGTNSIYIADAANFPQLPSKNHSLTIMANSMRIAEGIKGILA